MLDVPTAAISTARLPRATIEPMPYGFKYLLVTPDGEPHNPAAFVTAVPNWKEGELITLGNGQRTATVYALFLDRQGHIVSTDAELTNATVPPRMTVSMTLSGNYSTTAQIDAVASGKVSVDPCGGELSRVCPVAGAG